MSPLQGSTGQGQCLSCLQLNPQNLIHIEAKTTFSSVQFLLKEFFNENNEPNKLSLYVSILFLIINCVATQP